MRLGLVSDVHATPGPLEAALELFAREGVEAILCAGDIAGYGDDLDTTVELLEASGCRAILGNHDRWLLDGIGGGARGRSARYLGGLPAELDLEIAGQRVHAVHASPPGSLMDGIRLLDETGRIDAAARAGWSARLAAFDREILVVGHTHQLFAEELGGTLVVNPGSTLFNRSCAILDLPSRRVRLLPLPGERLLRTWCWRGGWR